MYIILYAYYQGFLNNRDAHSLSWIYKIEKAFVTLVSRKRNTIKCMLYGEAYQH